MKRFNDVMKDALTILANKEKYAYFYGAKGCILTDAMMNSLIKAESSHFSRYTPQQIEEIKNYSRGKIGYDCSGFITAITGVTGNSTTLWKKCVPNASKLYGFAGSILWKQGHIGIDIGYGKFLHFPTEMHTCELGTIADYNWSNSGLINGVDYWGASNV